MPADDRAEAPRVLDHSEKMHMIAMPTRHVGVALKALRLVDDVLREDPEDSYEDPADAKARQQLIEVLEIEKEAV